MVRDMNGVKILPGQTVIVHQEEGAREARVVEVFGDNPTTREPGFWVDIDDGSGQEGMMSYILEVKNQQDACCGPVEEEAWMQNFLTLEEKWIAWDETQANELGRFDTRAEAVVALKERGKELDLELRERVKN